MHTTINYTSSPSPKFDAVEDIKQYLGQAKWDELFPLMAKVKSPSQFQSYCYLAGVQGLPVTAWYDLYHGEGAYDRNWDGDQAND